MNVDPDISAGRMRLAPESLSLSAEVVSVSMSYLAVAIRDTAFFSSVATVYSLVRSGARSHFTASSDVLRQSRAVFGNGLYTV